MQSMGPIERAIAFGDVSGLVTQLDPNQEEQLPETQNDVLAAKRAWDLNPTEANGKTYVAALRRCSHYDEADAFAFKHLKIKPKFTIIDGY
jgi:hypothetical protein